MSSRILAVARWLGFEPIHYKQGCGVCDLGVEILDPISGDRRYWRPDTDLNDLALAYAVLEERQFWDDFLIHLGLDPSVGWGYEEVWGVMTAPAPTQFAALERVMMEEQE